MAAALVAGRSKRCPWRDEDKVITAKAGGGEARTATEAATVTATAATELTAKVAGTDNNQLKAAEEETVTAALAM